MPYVAALEQNNLNVVPANLSDPFKSIQESYHTLHGSHLGMA